MEEMLNEADDDDDIPMDDIRKKNIKIFRAYKRRENLPSSTCSRPISSEDAKLLWSQVVSYIVLIWMVRGVI